MKRADEMEPSCTTTSTAPDTRSRACPAAALLCRYILGALPTPETEWGLGMRCNRKAEDLTSRELEQKRGTQDVRDAEPGLGFEESNE